MLGELKRAVDFLHDMGSIVAFRDDSVPTFSECVILDPQWLTKAFASVVGLTGERAVTEGVLKHSQFHHIWKNKTESVHR